MPTEPGGSQKCPQTSPALHQYNAAPRTAQNRMWERYEQLDQGSLPPEQDAAVNTVIRNIVVEYDVSHWHGMAGEFMHGLVAAQDQLAAHGDWVQTADQITTAVTRVKAQTVKEQVHTGRLSYAHFRWMPDGTVLVVSDYGGWSQVIEPSRLTELESVGLENAAATDITGDRKEPAADRTFVYAG